MDYRSLIEDDPDAGIDAFQERLNAASDGDTAALTDCATILKSLFEVDELDAIHDLLEDLPDDCPSGLVAAVIDAYGDAPESIDEVVAMIGGHQSLSVQDLELMLGLTGMPNEADSDVYNASKCGRASVAACTNASEDMLEAIAVDPTWALRYRVALNEAVNVSAQRALLESVTTYDTAEKAEIIQAALAGNPATDPNLLEELAAIDSPVIRSRLKTQAVLPKSVVEILGQFDDEGFVETNSALIWWR